MSFFPLIFFDILDLVGKMPMKVWFIKEVIHNNIYKKKKNIKRVYRKQHDTNRQKHQKGAKQTTTNGFEMEFDVWWIRIWNDFGIVIVTITKIPIINNINFNLY